MRQSLTVLLAVLTVVATFAPAAVAADPAEAASNDIQADGGCEYPVELEDATGERITIDEPPESVVALQASDARTMFDIGAEDRLVGMPQNPATADLEAGNRTSVTSEYEVQVERVVDLEPDVVLAANITSPETVQQLRDAGVTVYHFRTAQSLDGVRDNTNVTGQLVGECDGARETVQWMNQRLEVVETAVDDAERPLAYYEMSDGQTTGADTFQHEVLTTAGLENLAANAGIEGWGQLNSETIVERDPAWIVYPDWADAPQVPDSVESTTAYQEENFVAVSDNRMNQPTPQIVYEIEEIVRTVHPEAYEEAEAALEDGNQTGSDEGNESGDENGSDTSDGNESESGNGTDGDENGSDGGNGTDDGSDGSDGDDGSNSADDSGGTDTDGGTDDGTGGSDEESDDEIPGFGVPIAVLALTLGLGVGLRRR